jgi:hypothetical protein
MSMLQLTKRLALIAALTSIAMPVSANRVEDVKFSERYMAENAELKFVEIDISFKKQILGLK